MPFLITPAGALSTKETKPFEQNAYRVNIPTYIPIGKNILTTKGLNDKKHKSKK